MPVGEYSGEVFIEQLEGERWPLSDYQIELFTPVSVLIFVHIRSLIFRKKSSNLSSIPSELVTSRASLIILALATLLKFPCIPQFQKEVYSPHFHELFLLLLATF